MTRFEELAKRAAVLGLDVKVFEVLKPYGEIVAVKALEAVIKAKETALDQIDHVQVFHDESGPEIQVLFDSLSLMRVLVEGYNAKHSAKLSLNLDAENAEELIGERKRGPRSMVFRDMPAFAKNLKAAGFTTTLRLKDARDGVYHSATLQADGTVKNADGAINDSVNDWASMVYEQAVAAGKRETSTCNVWVSVEIAKKDGGYTRLGEAYDEGMAQHEH